MTTMNTPEQRDQGEGRTSEQLMSDAEGGFNLSHAFVPHDADYLRLGAADMFEQGAGKLLYEKLTTLGVTDDEIDKLAEEGLLLEALQRLAPAEMEEIRQRIQRITASDPHARNALDNQVYFTEREQGRTKND